MRHQTVFSIIAACLIIYSCSSKTNPVDEEPKIKVIIDDFKKFWETKDTSILYRIMAHNSDMVNFGSDANEVFIGWNALRDSVQKLLPMIDKLKINIKDQKIKVGPSSDVAWFSEIWDWDFIFSGQPVNLPNQRLTGVLEKRNGYWVIVQFHNSVPVTQ